MARGPWCPATACTVQVHCVALCVQGLRRGDSRLPAPLITSLTSHKRRGPRCPLAGSAGHHTRQFTNTPVSLPRGVPSLAASPPTPSRTRSQQTYRGYRRLHHLSCCCCCVFYCCSSFVGALLDSNLPHKTGSAARGVRLLDPSAHALEISLRKSRHAAVARAAETAERRLKAGVGRPGTARSRVGRVRPLSTGTRARP